MQFQRSSGILLHITSLPSYGGIGDLGPAAHEFVAFLAAAKQHIWQVLPLGPTGYGNSPYAASSAFAGNPSLISLEFLRDWGWLEDHHLAGLSSRNGNVNFQKIEERKLPLLYEAAGNFLDRAPHNATMAEQWRQFTAFCQTHASWLNDYALYAELRRKFNTGAWMEWPEPLRRRNPEALREIATQCNRELAQEKALQFAFALQWDLLRRNAAQHGIRILGDVAIFVNMDSADVWANPHLFEMDDQFKPQRVAGVPPDYFSPTGQRWGNPLYRWDVLEESGFAWWIARIRRSAQLYDILRLDHFRGFEAYWAIPAQDSTAEHGQWIEAPGLKLFRALEAALGRLPLVAEDLGVITPAVDALRQELGMPGMKVLQFGFGGTGAHIHLPHRYTPDTVAYTGTHDNDTTQGWWNATSENERDAVETYVGPVLDRPVWPMIRAVQDSVAQIAVVPAQDLLELGSEARMNTPSVPAGNWSWRVPEASWKPDIAQRLAALTEVTDRDNDPLKIQKMEK